MLPKFKVVPWPCKPEGIRPPLAGGWGIGDGEVAGDVILGFPATARLSDGCTILCAIAGDADPNLMPAGLPTDGPPFGM
jgi:hypothetical protein